MGDNSGWHLRNLTGEAKAPKAAGNPDGYYFADNKTEHVVYRGEDGHIHELYLPNEGKWMTNDLTATTKAPTAAGDPAGFAEEGNKTEHIVYRSTDGNIIELYVRQGDNMPWRFNDLTMQANAPKAAGNPDAYYWKDTRTNHVVYRGSDGDVHELFLNTDGKWAQNDLSQSAKAPKAAGDPAGYTERGTKTEHIVYRAADGEVIELYAKQGDTAGWRFNDLNATTKAPKAAGNPSGYVVNEGGATAVHSEHIVYRGSDENVYEVYTDVNGKWLFRNLTELTKTPKAANDPVGYVQHSNKTQHVVFRGADGKIYELYNAPQAGAEHGWNSNNLSASAKPTP
jgi:catechol 2,3-dioxygenase-like lactoylglutathione lyase family enzyme